MNRAPMVALDGRFPRRLLGALLLAAGMPAPDAGLRAGTGGPVVYDLREGSVLRDECLPCDRAPIERPITGSFIFVPEESGARYTLTSLVFQDPAAEYAGGGSGSYGYSLTGDLTQSVNLDVEINGTTGIRLESGPVKVSTPWPAIDITATEPGSRDPFHVFTLRLVAAPQVELTRHELQEGSTLVRDCGPCAPPAILIPIEGTFLLGEIAGAPNPTSTFRVDAIDFRGTGGGQDWTVAGSGIYRNGGEVAVLQQMDLVVTINDQSGVHLVADAGTIVVGLPAIDIELDEVEPPGIFVYSLHIVARPAEKPGQAYRRGDADADGRVGLTDAHGILSWLFTHGAAPACLDAADVNDDEAIDVSDSLFLLFYLYLDGTKPPAPGPHSCGFSPTPPVGCEAYASC